MVTAVSKNTVLHIYLFQLISNSYKSVVTFIQNRINNLKTFSALLSLTLKVEFRLQICFLFVSRNSNFSMKLWQFLTLILNPKLENQQ